MAKNRISVIVVDCWTSSGRTHVLFDRKDRIRTYYPSRKSCDRLDHAFRWSASDKLTFETGFVIDVIYTYPEGISIKYRRFDYQR